MKPVINIVYVCTDKNASFWAGRMINSRSCVVISIKLHFIDELKHENCIEQLLYTASLRI